MSNPGLDDANIGIPATEQQTDLQQLVDQIEGSQPDEPVAYVFGKRIFREITPYA